MATDIAGLFGLTPEGLNQQRYQQDLKQGYELAQLSRGDAARATLQAGVGQLGRGVAGLLGVEDPQMQLMTARQQIFSQVDQSNPQSYVAAAKQLNQIGDIQGAVAMMDYGRQVQSDMALTAQRKAAEQASLAQAAKTQFGIDQEKQLRDELAKLGANATSDQIVSVVTKYGPPDKVLSVLQGSADRATANQARIDAAKIAADARIDAAREAGANRMQIAQMQADARRDIAMMQQSFKEAQMNQPINPKDLQKREAAYPQATSAIKGFESKSDSFIKDLEALRDDPGLNQITGPIYGRTPSVSKEGSRAQALYDKIVAKGGFQALQDLRDSSKTGGALGNVSNQEGKQLAASFAAIDRRQNAEDVKAAINQAIGDIEGSKTRLKEAYDMTYAYRTERIGKSLSGQDQQALDWANSNPKDPRSAQIKKRLGVQ